MSSGARGAVTGDPRPLGERLARAFRELSGREERSSAPATAGEIAAGRMPRGVRRRSVYKGAEVSRLLADWLVGLGAPDTEMRGDLRLLRARARELRRNNPYIRQYVNLLKANVLGHAGMQLQAQVRKADGKGLEQEVNATVERSWKRYWNSPVSADGRLTGNDFSALALETTAGDGETFVRMLENTNLNPFGLSLQMIDADLVDDSMNILPSGGQSEVRLGIEIDGYGRPMRYWIAEQQGYSPGASYRVPRYPIDAADVLHLYRPLRPNQSRGLTWFAPAMMPIQHLNGYTEAELIASRSGASKMGFIVTKDAADAGAPADDGTGEGATPVELEANPGSIEELEPGQEFQEWDPTHPTTAFADFTKAVLRQIATGLGVSYNALANDLENVNYSSIRSGLLIERDLWRMLQGWWEGAFMTPVYRRWLNTALLTGELPLRDRDWRRYTEVRWVKRGWPWVDPKSDIEASEKALELRLTSRSRILAETGDDFEEVLREQAAEEQLAKEIGVSLAAPAKPGSAGAGPDDEEDEDDDEKPAASSRSRCELAAALNGKQH